MTYEPASILECNNFFGSIWISPFITGHFECVTSSIPFEHDSEISLIRACMDIPNNPKYTLGIGFNDRNKLLLLNNAAEGYIPKNSYPGYRGSVSYSIHLDLPISPKIPYTPRFYVSIYFDIFFHKKGVFPFLPYIKFNQPLN